MKKIDALEKMQPFPEVWLCFAEFRYSFFLSGNAVHLHSVSVSINRMMSPSNAVDLESPLIAALPLHQVGQCHTHLRTSRVVSNEHRYDSKARVLFFHDNP